MPNCDQHYTDMKRLPLNDAIKPLAWLKGTWKTDGPGIGIFPTIETFKYCEEISFTSIGQPMLNYRARSWHSETKMPMHYEVGFLKIVPNTNRLVLLLAHNIGVTTVEEGVFEDKVITLKTTGIQRATEESKPPPVIELQREFKLVGNNLQHTLCMATTKTPQPHEHLRATYTKACEDDMTT
ncbi:peroxynitrite isomerase THAP4 [Andrena cerasifolii]|uniref:peroxynitrite isomerase THAP4 n=1 Tax=Andrena cerasifolii TaxID=2819439 RepID=UPI0040384196